MGYHSVEEIVGIIIPSNKYENTPKSPPCNLQLVERWVLRNGKNKVGGQEGRRGARGI